MKSRPIPTFRETQEFLLLSSNDDIRLDEGSALTVDENERLEAVWKLVNDVTKREETYDWREEEEEEEVSLIDSYERWIEINISDYNFEVENPYLNHELVSEEALKLLEGGDIAMAVLALEVAVQREPENSDLWLKLGTTQAENEKENAAIKALRISIKLNPNNLPAWMVSERRLYTQLDFRKFHIIFIGIGGELYK